METFFLGGVSLISSVIQCVTGFGFGIIMMAVMPLFLPYPVAMNVSTVLSLFLNLAILLPCIKNVNWKQLALPAIFCVVGSTAGNFLIAGADMGIYKRLLGVFLIMLAIWLYFFSSKVKIKPTPKNAAIAGIVSGMCGGLFSVSGPPMVLYLVSVLDDKQEYMATTQCYFLINNIYLLSIRFAMHTIPGGIMTPVIFGTAGLLLGSVVGGKIFKKLNPQKVKTFVYAFMAISGLWIAING